MPRSDGADLRLGSRDCFADLSERQVNAANETGGEKQQESRKTVNEEASFKEKCACTALVQR